MADKYLENERFAVHDEELSTGELDDVTQYQVALVIRVDSENSRHHVHVPTDSKVTMDT